MGNWSRQEVANHAARAANAEAIKVSQAELDERFPPMERPCGTPGAVYSIIVEGGVLVCTVQMPFDIETSLPPEAKEKMKAALHDAILPIIETFYRRVWEKTIAGKEIDGDRMPKRWEQLFTTWIRRLLERNETGHIINNEFTLYSLHSVPERYRPDNSDMLYWPRPK